MLGAVTIAASALITGGIGPWLPFQMFGAAWMGFGAGCLPPLKGRAELVMLAGYAAISAVLYGTLLNLWFWPFGAGTSTAFSFSPGAGALVNLHRFVLFDLTTSLGFDISRAVTNAVLVLLLGRPVMAALAGPRDGRRSTPQWSTTEPPWRHRPSGQLRSTMWSTKASLRMTGAARTNG